MKKRIMLGIISCLCIAMSGCGSTETKTGLPEDIAAQAITNDEVANRTCIVTPSESCDVTGICYYDDENDKRCIYDTSKRTSILGEEEAMRVREVFFWLGGEKHVIRDKEDILTFTDAVLQVKLDEREKIVHEVPVEGCVDIYMVLDNGDMISFYTYGGKSVNFKGAEYPCETNFFELVMILAGEKRDTSWGLTLEATEVTPTGLTLVCTQSGCKLEGQLQTGSWYVLEQKTSSGWNELEYVQKDVEVCWTDEVAILLIANTSKEWKVDWSWLYGELSPGIYRIKKSFDNLIDPGNFEVHNFYAEFTIEEE